MVGSDSTTMRQPAERGQGQRQDLMTGGAVQVGNKANTTGFMIEARIDERCDPEVAHV